MQRVRGVVLDVDGTLLDPAHRISRANRAAVRRARDAGMMVMLASGRSPVALEELLAELELDGAAIAYTGALTFRRDAAGGPFEVLAQTPLAPADAVAVLRLADAHGVEVGWFEARGWRVRAAGPGAAEEAALTGEPPQLSPALPDGAAPPLKLMCIAPDDAGVPALHAMRAALPAGTRGVFSHPRYLEVTAAGVDKGQALRVVAAELGIPLDELAAIGDQENDIGMLREVGVGIAMGNAGPAVRAAADRVTDTNARDGVARALAALLAG